MADKKPLIAKITRPSVSGVYLRKKLFKVLDSGRRKPVTWISGPAGSGKTTLAASYMDARKLPCLWYQIDKGDTDIASFFYYLGLAALQTAPRHRKPLPLLTPEYLMGISTFSRRFFEELYSRFKTPFVLVFDNCQYVPDESPLQEIIQNGLSALPEGITVIMISRRDPPPALARLRASTIVELIGWDQLRLIPEEEKAIMRLHTKRRLPLETISYVHEKANGWAAGLVLLIERTKAEAKEPRPISLLSHEEIYSYFAGEVLDKLDSETRDFLLVTSIFPRITVKTAEQLTGQKNAAVILSRLTDNNFFTEKHLHHSEQAYQFHPLFREFLQARVIAALDREGVVRLQKAAAQLLLEDGQIEDAMQLLCDAGDRSGLAPLILSQAQTLMAQGRGRTLEEWLEKIPKELIEKAPWLLYWLAVCRMPVGPAGSRTYFERAFHMFDDHNDQAGTLLSWAGIIDTYCYEFSDFKPLDRWLDWLDSRLLLTLEFPSVEIEAQVASSVLSVLVWRRPDHPHVRNWLGRALSSSQKTGNINLRLKADINAAIYFLFAGEVADCNMVLNDLRQMVRTGPASPLLMISLKMIEASVIASYGGRPDPYELVSDGLRLARETGIRSMDSMLLAQGTYQAFQIDDMAALKEFLREMEAVSERSRPNDYAHYLNMSAWYSLRLADIPNALARAEAALGITAEMGMLVPEIMCRQLLSLILFSSGERRQAAAYLAVVKDMISGLKSCYFDYIVLLMEALFTLEGSGGEDGSEARRKKGLTALRGAMELGRRRGYLTLMFFWLPSAAVRLCIKALEADIEKEHVRKLILACGLFPDDPPLELEDWPWPVRIRTFGKFELVVNEKPVAFSGKAQKKPLDLLKALVALGGREVAENQLTGILWPDSEGDAAHSTFATTVSRLRQLLGNEKALQIHEGKATLDPRYCWVDVWAFERLVQDTEQEMRNERQKDKTSKPALRNSQAAVAPFASPIHRFIEKVFILYRGSFLSADTAHSWTVSSRERLRNMFLRLISKAGAYYEDNSKWPDALELYQRALDIDELCEEFYQGLMACHLKLGHHAETVAAYKRCKQTLHTAFDISPSDKTEALYRTVVNTT